MKRRLLFNGDAVATTGFARATHKLLDVLRHSWDVHCLGINHWGDPNHGYQYPIYPANPGGFGDAWGLWRIEDLLKSLRPDVLVLQNDPWNVAEYVKRWAKTIPIVAWMPVDGKNCQGDKLNGLALAVFYTHFALEEARKGGYRGPACVIGLGVDRSIYLPLDQRVSRSRVLPSDKVPVDAFIVGNVNRNQPRKRLDLSVAYFAEWIRSRGIDDAYLYLHLCPTGDKGWDLRQLARYYGVANRTIFPPPSRLGVGVSETYLAEVYNTFSVQINTGSGEGFGLTTLEGLSCGVQQVVGDWAALGEWAEGAIRVACTSTSATVNDINTIGGIPDRVLFQKALDYVYQMRGTDQFEQRRQDAVAFASAPEFQWSHVGLRFAEELDRALAEPLTAIDVPLAVPVGDMLS